LLWVLTIALRRAVAIPLTHSPYPIPLSISLNHSRLTTLSIHTAFPQTQIRSRSVLWPQNAALNRSSALRVTSPLIVRRCARGGVPNTVLEELDESAISVLIGFFQTLDKWNLEAQSNGKAM
jgi:hypothetical protein